MWHLLTFLMQHHNCLVSIANIHCCNHHICLSWLLILIACHHCVCLVMVANIDCLSSLGLPTLIASHHWGCLVMFADIDFLLSSGLSCHGCDNQLLSSLHFLLSSLWKHCISFCNHGIILLQTEFGNCTIMFIGIWFIYTIFETAVLALLECWLCPVRKGTD